MGGKLKLGVGWGKDTGKALDHGVMATGCEGGNISNLVPDRPEVFRASQGLPMQPFHVQRLLRMKAADTTGLGAQTLWGPPRARSGSLFGKAPSLCTAVTFLENANKTMLTLKIL